MEDRSVGLGPARHPTLDARVVARRPSRAEEGAVAETRAVPVDANDGGPGGGEGGGGSDPGGAAGGAADGSAAGPGISAEDEASGSSAEGAADSRWPATPVQAR